MKAGAANATNIEMIDEVFECARMAIFIAHAFDEVAVNLASIIAFGKALPTCADRMRTNGDGSVVQELDNDIILCLFQLCLLYMFYG